jgi:hypothetical protein
MSLFVNATSNRGFPALNDLPWRTRTEVALSEACKLLCAEGLPNELVSWLSKRSRAELAHITDRSLERATHFKWFLGARPAEYVVWLHEYKPPEIFARETSFAASVHNHRYGFCSRVLRGALHVSAFAVSQQSGEIVRLVGRYHIDVGGTMTLSHEDVHRIDEVAPDTCTILIQGPAARHFSTCYDPVGGPGRRVYDMQSRLPQMLAVLTGGRSSGVTAM